MKAIMVMYDSLNKRLLESYGCEWTKTPNFNRLAEKTVIFDNFYAASLPCMPARRDIHSGRYNFLHRSWGPIEPFDNSMPKILQEHGIYTRLVSDHDHYWEDGGCTYHTMYSSWEAVRGQEADPWEYRVDMPDIPKHVPTMREFTHPSWWRHNWCNKELIHSSNEWPQNLVFDKGLQFLEKNKDKDNWFIQIETFDPHEPFDSPKEFQDMYPENYTGDHFDWPSYAPVTETTEEVRHIRNKYAALLSMCDRNLGRILDFMDANNMWQDTLFIVNTDHGFMLGEKDWWAKSVMPCYNELANIPFFLWDPRIGKKNERINALCQTIDIPATILEYFGVDRPPEMKGHPLSRVLKENKSVRKYALFGYHGSFVNITDGEMLYMRAAASISNQPLYEYTLMPMHQDKIFSPEELSETVMVDLPFGKGCKVMKIPVKSRLANPTFCNSFQYGHKLFDLRLDPEQLYPLNDPMREADMINALIAEMKKNDAPIEQYQRLGLDFNYTYTADRVIEDKHNSITFESFPITKKYFWTQDAKHIFIGMLSLLTEKQVDEYFHLIDEVMENVSDKTVTRKHFETIGKKIYSTDEGKLFYFLNKLSRIN
ncbi:sulfatase [Treponema sp. HNW]|uniref:sulfatase n=1 Tax=Treponema sp. HNW TaxID=3116654 RepID=UPI003D0CA889